jgi:hypothetical protein
MADINPFNDIADNGIQTSTDFYGQDLLDNVAAIKVGAGARAFKADESGIWLGANKFEDAPFSVDLDGNVIATSIDLSNYLDKSATNEQVSGTIRLGTGTGTASIILDGANRRIIVNDGTYDRVLIGYQSGGF